MIKKFAFVLLIILIFSLPFIHFYNGITDPFLFRNVGYADKFLDRNTLPIDDHRLYEGVFFYAPASEIITIMISKIIGIRPKYLQFVPILIIPLIFSLYLFVKRVNILNSSPILNLLIVWIIILNIGKIGTNSFTIWPHSWAYTLLILNISILYDIFDKKSYQKTILFLIIFAAIHLYSYTVELWMVWISILYLVLLIFIKTGSNSRFYSKLYDIKNNLNIDNMKMDWQIKKSYSLSLVMLIIMLVYNRMIFYSYLPKRTVELEINSLSIFLEKYFQVQGQEYASYTYKVPSGYSKINILFMIAIMIPILIGIIRLIHNPKKYINNSNIFWYCVIISLLGVAIIDMIIYSLAGVITFRYLILIYPAISISFIFFFNKNKITRFILLGLILSLSIIGPISAYYYGIFNISQSRYVEFEPGCYWFLNKSESKIILGDQSSIDKCFLEATIKGMNINKSYFVDSTYAHVISDKEINQNFMKQKIKNGYIFLNMKFGRIDNIDWRQYQPFTKYTYSINNNTLLDKIYSDEILWIMKPV